MEKAKPTQPAPQPAPKHHTGEKGHHTVNPSPKPAVKKSTKGMCESHMHRYVEIQAADGYCYDGIVEYVDDEWVCLAVPGSVEPMRGYFPSPFFPPFGGGFSPYRPRRFNRMVLPIAGLAAISPLPYYW